MSIDYLVRQTRRGLVLALGTAAVATLASLAACGSDTTTSPATSVSTTPRAYDQVQRLGNPLVSEVFLMKKDHAYHGSLGPSDDVAAFATKLKGFVAAFRPQATTLQATLASVLLPDMLIVQTDKATTTAGWLSWALSNGYGGRQLSDDVVDTGLSAIFSDLLDPTQFVCKPGTLPLCTDNIGTHSKYLTTFPYVGVPN
jgi:hypothetical protein